MSVILDRVTPPKYKTVSKIDIPPISKEKTVNGVPVFFVSGGTQDVVQVELIFKAGTSTGSYPLTPPSLRSRAASLRTPGHSTFPEALLPRAHP